MDRSFVSGLGEDSDDKAIVNAVLAMSQALGLSVVAEGVETQIQRDELIRMGCQAAQGYLFSRPLTAEDATDLLTSGVRLGIAAR